MVDDVKLRMLAPQMREAAGRFRKADPGSALDKMILAWAETAVAELREATPVEQEPIMKEHPPAGSARANWRFDHEPAQKRVKITNEMPYAPFLITGTRPHRITPKTPGGYLSFFWVKMNENVVLPSVNHPGTQPVSPLVTAIERLGPTATTMLSETGVKIMRDIAGFG